MVCGYPTLPESRLSFSDLVTEIQSLQADLLITHAFMKLLPERVFNAPRLGSINIHPSILPKYRGPSPGHWVIANKEKETGLTCHKIDRGMDTGDIVYQVKIPVFPEDNVADLIERQKIVVKDLLAESLKRLENKNFKPVPQQSEDACFAPRPE